MRHPARWAALLASFVVATGCERKLTPAEAEQLLTEQYSQRSPATHEVHFQCRDGEADWLFVCQLQFTPTARGIQQGVRQQPAQRVGITRMGTYQGKPVLRYKVLPSEGAIPSEAELSRD
jgi:hypothetical protein